MVLDFRDDVQTLFKHSKEFDQGVGTRTERIGQATVVVSLDGTGDTDDIQHAIDMLPSAGGVVFIKEGTYNIKKMITINKSNVKLEGTGNGTLLKSTTLTDSQIIVVVSDYAIISNIRFDTSNNDIIAIVFASGNNSSVNFCSFQNNVTQYSINTVNTSNLRVIGNDVGTGAGLLILGNNNLITGNSGNTMVISLVGDQNQITGNYLSGAHVVSGDKNQIISNTLKSINDEGTNTQIGHNTTI